MVLKPLFMLPVLGAVLLLTLAGCEDRAGVPGPWGGRLVRTAERVGVQGAQWRNFPEWETWETLADRAEIVVAGSMSVPGEPMPAAFSCRMVRLSGMRYSLQLQSELNGVPLTLRGEADLQKHSAALDLRGRFAPAQYATWFGIEPKLTSGLADVRGSLLFVGGAMNMSMPQLTISPVGQAEFRLGCFPLRDGRFDRRETFDGRTELDLYGMGAVMGGMRLEFSRITLDREKAVFQLQLTPPAPWQCSVKPRGNGECALDREGKWRVTAELPEAGVCRFGGAILPLRDLRIAGAGDDTSGSWDWSGDGASLTLQNEEGTGTGNEIRVAGHRDLRFDGRETVISGVSFAVSCGKFEQPFVGGRLEMLRPRLEMRRVASGLLRCQGSAEEVVWRQKSGETLRLKNWDGAAELVMIHDRPVTPEAGEFRCGAAEWENGTAFRFRADGGKGTVLLQEKAWKVDFSPKTVTGLIAGRSLELAAPALTFRGGADAPKQYTVTGSGRQGVVRIGKVSAECGEWEFSAERQLSDPAFGDFSFDGKQWRFSEDRESGTAVRIACRSRLLDGGRRDGRITVEKISAGLEKGSVKNLSADIPFGTTEKSGKITADALSVAALQLAGLTAELRPAADGMSVKGRAREERTGGVCFITGNIRPDLRGGAIEYQTPAATLLRELPVAELMPIPGDWIFAGKFGETGRLSWQDAKFDWRRQCRFSGFARSAECMAEELSGEAELAGPDRMDIRLLFRRMIAGQHEARDGELFLKADGGPLKVTGAKFSAWGGDWSALPEGGFSVRHVRLDQLLPVEGWNKPFSGTFSGTVRLSERVALEQTELVSDAAGVMKLGDMEPYRLLPADGYSMMDLNFTEAAVREFQYRTMRVKLLRRGGDLMLRVSGDGRPARPVPFVFEGGGCRPTRGGETGFSGEVEIGCGYRIGGRELGISQQTTSKGAQE